MKTSKLLFVATPRPAKSYANQKMKLTFIALVVNLVPACGLRTLPPIDSASVANVIRVSADEIALKPMNCEYAEGTFTPFSSVFKYCVLTVTNNAVYLADRNDPSYVLWWWQNQNEKEHEKNRQVTQFKTIPFADIKSVAVSESKDHKQQLQIFRAGKENEKMLAINFYYKSPNDQDEPNGAQATLAFLQNHTHADVKTNVAYIDHYVQPYQPATYYPNTSLYSLNHQNKSLQSLTNPAPFPTLTPSQMQRLTTPPAFPLSSFK